MSDGGQNEYLSENFYVILLSSRTKMNFPIFLEHSFKNLSNFLYGRFFSFCSILNIEMAYLKDGLYKLKLIFLKFGLAIFRESVFIEKHNLLFTKL